MSDKCEIEQNERHVIIKVGCMEIYAESNHMHDLITITHADDSPFRFKDKLIVDIENGEVFNLSKDPNVLDTETIKNLMSAGKGETS